MDTQWQRILSLTRRTGDRLVVMDPDGIHVSVVMSLEAYEDLVDGVDAAPVPVSAPSSFPVTVDVPPFAKEEEKKDIPSPVIVQENKSWQDNQNPLEKTKESSPVIPSISVPSSIPLQNTNPIISSSQTVTFEKKEKGIDESMKNSPATVVAEQNEVVSPATPAIPSTPSPQSFEEEAFYLEPIE